MRPSLAAWALAAALLAGCDTRPRAPALGDDAVFQSNREGIRFLAPDGWTQTVRGEPPPGKVEKERPLVEYARTSGGPPASLRVSLADLPESTDLPSHLSGPSYSAKKWDTAGPAESTVVGSASGTRYTLTGRVGATETIKEVVVVRRGERVYFFTALYAPKDTEAREKLRQVVGSVIWKK